MESNEVNASFFPPPPPRYQQFTNQNLKLANRLIGSSLNQVEGDQAVLSLKTPFDPHQQVQILKSSLQEEETVKLELEESNLEKIDLRNLIIPPDLDWIQENQGWVCFGDREPWPGQHVPASLEGMPKLYPPELERKEALQLLLNTLIHSYMELLNVLRTHGPISMATMTSSQPHHHPPPSRSSPDQIISHIELAAFNMHGLCNELRPRQARETLKLMLKEQAREKREKAEHVLQTCEELRKQLENLTSPPDPKLISRIKSLTQPITHHENSSDDFTLSLDLDSEDWGILMEACNQITTQQGPRALGDS